MLPCSGCVGGAPGHVLPCVGAGCVGDPQMTEREHTGHVILRSSLCNTGRDSDWLHWTRGEGCVAAVAPIVCHNSTIAVHHGGTPWGGGGGVCAVVVLHIIVCEGEDTLSTIIGGAGVGYSAGGLGAREL